MRFVGLSTHIRILCLCLLSGQVVSVLSGAPGDLDSTFGSGGQLITTVGAGDSGAHDVALQSDGKVVTVGYFHNGIDDDFAVVRYNTDGTLDTSFNGTGIATTDFGGNNDTARGVAIQPDGKIVAVGASLQNGVWPLALARFNPDGTLDTTFGSGGAGRITTAIGYPDSGSTAEHVTMLSDGRFLVAGHARIGIGDYDFQDFVLLRYLADGNLDTSFGTGGLVSVSFGRNTDYGFDLAVQPDGKILVGGKTANNPTSNAGNGPLLARVNADGTLDTGFGTAGLAFFNNMTECYGIALQGDGKTVMVGTRGLGLAKDFCLTRCNTDGSLDTGFGVNGVVVTPIGTASDEAYDLALHEDGKIVAVGESYNANTGFSDFALARYHEDGTLDTTFRSTGRLTTNFPGGDAQARSVFIAQDGRITVAGDAHDGIKNRFALARYSGLGSLITTSPAHHSQIKNTMPTIEGRATPGLAVDVYVDNVVVGSTVADVSGNWSFLVTSPLIDGLHTAAANDGNGGPLSNIVSFTVDTVAPVSPGISTPSEGAQSNSSWPVIAGTAEAGTNVTVYIDDVAAGNAIGDGSGQWSFTPYTPLSDGPHMVKATATDLAGNTGPFSSTLNFTVLAALFGGPGNPDTTFGGVGNLATSVGAGDSGAYDVALQSDGKVVTVGYFHNGIDDDFAVVRYNTDGTLDTSFNGTGIATTDFGGNNDTARGVAIQPDGKIVAVGASLQNGVWPLALARFNPDGTLDTTFGSGGAGRITTAIGYPDSGSTAEHVTMLSDGRFLVAGHARIGIGDYDFQDFVLLRYLADGNLDTSFGTGGLVSVSFGRNTDYGFDLAVQPDGKILVGGKTANNPTSNAGNGPLLARVNADGTLDTGFGTAGLAFFNNMTECYGIALQGDGKTVMVGTRGLGLAKDFCLTRCNTDGSLDTGFGVNGVVVTPIGTASDEAYDLALHEDGKIVAVGESYNANTGFSDFALARYHEDGTLDTTFRSTGRLTTNFPGGDAQARSVFIAQDGRITVAGDAHDGIKNRFALARYFGTAQPPVVVTGSATGVVRSGAVLDGIVNPNSLLTSAYFEYGVTTSYGNTSASVSLGDGFLDVPTSATITDLTDNTLYHYRLVGTNEAGVTYGEDRTFTTAPNPPLALTGDASNITATGATLAGVAIPNGRETTVWFEYGLTTAYGSSTDQQIVPSDGTLEDVFDSITDLVPGSTYHFRFVAINGGSPIPIHGEDKSFVAQSPPPTVVLGSVTPLTTTSVTLRGAVNAINSNTDVFFDYGTDGSTFPNSIAAHPGIVSGDQDTPVSASLGGLSQGVTYYYRLRGVNGGAGVSMTDAASFTLDLISGLTQTFPGSTPDAQGFMIVNLSPSGILPGWRFVGEQEWRVSGIPVGGLATGDREIEFRPVPGHIHPPTETVSIVSGEAAAVLDRAYFETDELANGGLTVTLKPESIATGPGRGQWRLLGEDDNAWRDSGATLGALPPGAYLIECKPVTGRTTPSNANVLVTDGQTAAPTITYFLAGTATGELPAALAFETVTTDTAQPFAFVGQIRSHVGLSTGFAVKERVVATAAHVVWDDGSLSAAEGLQWLHQRHGGTFEPKPQIPRGFYLLSGYDAQRQAEATPGSFSPESRNLDVAAMYFTDDAARGGYSGFLASDLDANEFLLSDANKQLVGYPVDGIAAGSRGRMHATSLFNVNFSPVGLAANRTFLTTDVRSSGGASGGPLCVQFDGGAYYPAAVYLGGEVQSIVRAIDSAVIDLFNRAELSGIDGQPHTGGGITHTSVTTIGGSSTPGALSVTIRPAEVATAGGWRLRPDNNYLASGAQRSGLNAGRYVLELAPVNGFQNPASQQVTVRGGQLKDITFTYALEAVADTVEINVSGNGRAISDGDVTSSATDHTDFGEVDVASGNITRTFTIANSGNTELSVGSIEIGGTHPDDFSVTVPPGVSVPGGGSTSFQITFDPSDVGTRSATVSFANNDLDESPFDFAIQGNETGDSDNNGFTDVEESGLQELLREFTIGETIDLDLSFLRLTGAQVMELTSLAPGLSYNPITGRLSGTIQGKPEAGAEIRKMVGSTVEWSLPFAMEVYEPAALTLSRVKKFPVTRVKRRSRPQTIRITNTGERMLSGLSVRRKGQGAKDFLVTRPGASVLNPGDGTSFRVAFRPRKKGSRKAKMIVSSSAGLKSLPLSGKGK